MLRFFQKNQRVKNKAAAFTFSQCTPLKSTFFLIFLFGMYSNEITFSFICYTKSKFKSKTSIFEYCRYSGFNKKFQNCFKIAFLCICSDWKLFFKQLHQNCKISNFFLENVENQNIAQKMRLTLRISHIFLNFF